MQTTTNYGLKKPEKNEFFNINDQNTNMDAIDAELKKGADHIADKSNPHSVTALQVDAVATLPEATPESTGYQTLLEYLVSLMRAGHKAVSMPVGQFSDLPRLDWTYGCTARLYGNIQVELWRFLSNGSDVFKRETDSTGAWFTNWVKVFTLNNPPTASEVGAIPSAGEYLYTSILEKAITLARGVYNYHLTGVDYTTNDLPNNHYAYGSATVFVRSGTAITVVVWGANANSAYQPAVNHYGGSTWTGWKVLPSTAEVISSAGGTIISPYNVFLALKTTSTANWCGISFANSIGDIGIIGMREDGNIYRTLPDRSKNYKVLDTGNSSPVVASATAPTDTTVLWVDTTAMKMKIYKNNAWTALT